MGRTYEAVIRINSQSGKGGVAYVMETDHGIRMPRRLQVEFSQVVQRTAEANGTELSSADIWRAFEAEYLDAEAPFAFVEHRTLPDAHASELRNLTATVRHDGEHHEVKGQGNGPIDAFVDALRKAFGHDFYVVDYREHALGAGEDATAVAYVEARTGDGTALFGVGRHANIVTASLRAVTGAVNRAVRDGHL